MKIMALKLFQFLFMLKLLVAGTSPPDPYRFVCEVQTLGNGFPNKLPPMCTSLASYSKTNEGMEAILSIRGPNMPFLRLFEDIGSQQWSDIFINNNEIENYVQIITKNKITAVAFAFESKDKSDGMISPERTDEILGFIGKLRDKCPDTLFGLLLVVQSEKLKNGYDLDKVDPKIDFYICHANNMRQCGDNYDKYPPVFATEMEKTVNVLKQKSYNMAKTLLFINTVHHSYKHGNFNYMPYGDTCSIRHSGKRYMCTEQLVEFQNKAYIAFKFQMKGLFVYSADYDDVLGACKCQDEDKSTNFPILKVLDKGLQNVTLKEQLAFCETWAKYQQ